MKNNIKVARERSGMMQKECSDYLQITLRAWQGYEQGIREPKFELLCKIADMFHVTTDYLLGREKAPDPFAELNLSTEDEQEVLAKYMSLPENVRAILLDVLIQLGDAVRANQTEQEDDCIYETTTAGEAHDRLDAQAHAEENAG